MISKEVESALNNQLNFELFSSYVYWSMSACLERLGLPGCANWMRIQTQEELTHADRFYRHLIERGAMVTLAPIEGPQTEWPNVLAAFENALDHERQVTARINDIMTLALEQKDHATANFLQWFIAEQVEEEASVDEIVQKLKLAVDAKGALFVLDQDLASRAFVPPAVEE